MTSRVNRPALIGGVGSVLGGAALPFLPAAAAPALIPATAGAVLIAQRRSRLVGFCALAFAISLVQPLLAVAIFAVALLVHGRRARLLIHPSWAVGIAASVYLLCGAPNLSTYRGSIRPETVRIILWHTIVFVLAAALVGGTRRPAAPPRAGPLASWLVGVAAIPGIIGFALVTAHSGIVVLHPASRFRISPLSLVLLESLVVPLAFFCYDTYQRRGPLPRDAIVLIPLIALLTSSGYRGWSIIAVAIVMFTLIYFKRIRVRPAHVLLVMVLVLAIGSGFDYVRRGTASNVLGEAAAAKRYQATRIPALLRPLHFGLRESIAITQRMIDIRASGEPHDPLLIADFRTLLPGGQKSGGGIVGDLIGRRQAGGLTPGAVGASVADLGSMSYVLFIGLGALSGILWRKALRRADWAIAYFFFVIYFVHFLHRGILKPSYVINPLMFAFLLALHSQMSKNVAIAD